MKCWSITQMEESLINRDLNKLEKHIESCSSCKDSYELLLREQTDWSNALFTASLPSSFTKRVMEVLQETDIAGVGEQVHNDMYSPKKAARRSYTTLQRWTSAAAILLVLCGSLIYASPSLAEIVRSMFVSDAVLDPGLLQSKELGLIQNPSISVSDNGYKIQVNEVSADATRLTIALKVTDRFGKAILNGFNPEQITVKDETGNSVGLLRSPLGTNEKVDVLTYIYKGELNSSILTVESQIDRIRQDEGDWGFSFAVDLSKADALTNVYKLVGRYVTPDGLIIQMDKLTHTPSGVKLEFTTSLGEQKINKVPTEMEERQTLMFHFENEHGETISKVNETDSISMLAGETSVRTDKGIHWVYTFIDMPFDTQEIKMVFDGYSIPETSDEKIIISPFELKKESAMFSGSGDKMWFKSFSLSEEPGQNETTPIGVLEVRGEYYNTVNPLIEQWMAVDDEGKKYNIEYRGPIDLNSKYLNGKFIIKGLSYTPKKLILSRNVIDRYYNNVEWSFDLPKGKRIPGLENNVPIKYWR
ncbi:DUF4179 domain-containing protein [Paenibacillus sp. 22594]|uniref:DUF4179 domain-containing protein n=1 Tax=Paenibacillus sp. 22594 TaxID=3453947 RepID=UPI003F85AB18